MAHILKFSEALALGLHSAALIGDAGGANVPVAQISNNLNASLAHLHKVLQRMTKANLLVSTRGPKGGYILTRNPKEIKLLEIFEAIDGPFPTDNCLFGVARCFGASCILGDFTQKINQQVYDYLDKTYLIDIMGKIVIDPKT